MSAAAPAAAVIAFDVRVGGSIEVPVRLPQSAKVSELLLQLGATLPALKQLPWLVSLHLATLDDAAANVVAVSAPLRSSQTLAQAGVKDGSVISARLNNTAAVASGYEVKRVPLSVDGRVAVGGAGTALAPRDVPTAGGDEDDDEVVKLARLLDEHVVLSRSPSVISGASSDAANPLRLPEPVAAAAPALAAAVVPPPVAVAFADTVTAIADTVVADMRLSDNLDEQRAMTNLGDRLLKAWPVTQLDADSEVPALAAELLPYIGDFDCFKDALNTTTSELGVQHCHTAVVAQASGSGKTRLAFAAGLDQWLVVIARVANHGSTLTSSWLAFIELAHRWRTAWPHLSDDQRSDVSQSGVAAVKLLAACHVQYVADVLRRVACGLDVPIPPASADADSAKLLQMAALRCLRNGRGDAAVGSLYKQRLTAATTESASVGSTVSVPRIDSDAVAAFCASADEALRALLWPRARILIWWDEAHGLFGEAPVFLPLRRLADDSEAAKPHDCFYGLSRACANLETEHKWLQCLCGTWVELSTRCGVDPLSPLRGLVTTVFHASRITEEHMLEVLRRYLNVDDSTTAALRPLLQKLVGRPIYFFDHMLRRMWQRICVTKPDSDEALQALIVDAAERAYKQGKRRLTDVLRDMWAKPAALPLGTSTTASLCADLYAGLMLHGGEVDLSAPSVAAALKTGVLALPLPPDWTVDDPARASLHEEPVLAAAILKLGDARVQQFADNPDQDPIYKWIAGQMAAAAAAGRDVLTGGKGQLFELLFVWLVLRTVKLHVATNGRVPTLAYVLQPVLAPRCDMPARAALELVMASAALPGRKGEPALTELHRLCEADAKNIVRFELDTDAGFDVAFVTVDAAFVPASAVGTQAKARAKTSLWDSLRSATSAWQFVNDIERDKALGGSPITRSDKRAHFEHLAASAATSSLFSGAFRVVLSLGYREESVDTCNRLNVLADGCAGSPVILCQPTAAAFGSNIMELLKSSFSKPKPAAHPKHLAMWLPQSLADVAAGIVVTEDTAVAAVLEAWKA